MASRSAALSMLPSSRTPSGAASPRRAASISARNAPSPTMSSPTPDGQERTSSEHALLGGEAGDAEPAVADGRGRGRAGRHEVRHDVQALGPDAGVGVGAARALGEDDDRVGAGEQRVRRDPVPAAPRQRQRRDARAVEAAVAHRAPAVARRAGGARGAVAEQVAVGAHRPEVVQRRDDPSGPVAQPPGAEVREEVVHVHHVGHERGELGRRVGADAGRRGQRGLHRVRRTSQAVVGVAGDERDLVPLGAQGLDLRQHHLVLAARDAAGVEAVDDGDAHGQAFWG